MADYTDNPCPAQPIRASVKRILTQTILNAIDPSDQKVLIMACYANEIYSAAETAAMINSLGLKSA